MHAQGEHRLGNVLRFTQGLSATQPHLHDLGGFVAFAAGGIRHAQALAEADQRRLGASYLLKGLPPWPAHLNRAIWLQQQGKALSP